MIRPLSDEARRIAANIAKLPAHWELPLDAPQGCRKRGGRSA